MKSKLYSLELRTDHLLAELENYFRMQGHQVQIIPVAGGQVLQTLKESTLSVITGQSSALTIKVMPNPNGTLVEIGASKWIDKAAAGVIGYVLLPPLILFPIIGMYNQYRLSEEAWRIIDSFASRVQASRNPPYNAPYSPGYTPNGWSGNPEPPPWTNQAPPNSQNCINCNSWLTPGATFCSGCGTQVTAMSAPICRKCGTTNLRGARFCSSCGDRFE
ncbi:MAG: zinc ribbon domain-containing protein [Acidobacteria bacterium]|nr:zinc ribbon domain-containing protein [Acidobacteriota bacterium]